MENDQLNIEQYAKEIASLLADAVQAAGKMFEEERLRMINMVTAAVQEEMEQATGSTNGSWSTKSL